MEEERRILTILIIWHLMLMILFRLASHSSFAHFYAFDKLQLISEWWIPFALFFSGVKHCWQASRPFVIQMHIKHTICQNIAFFQHKRNYPSHRVNLWWWQTNSSQTIWIGIGASFTLQMKAREFGLLPYFCKYSQIFSTIYSVLNSIDSMWRTVISWCKAEMGSDTKKLWFSRRWKRILAFRLIFFNFIGQKLTKKAHAKATIIRLNRRVQLRLRCE